MTSNYFTEVNAFHQHGLPSQCRVKRSGAAPGRQSASRHVGERRGDRRQDRAGMSNACAGGTRRAPPERRTRQSLRVLGTVGRRHGRATAYAGRRDPRSRSSSFVDQTLNHARQRARMEADDVREFDWWRVRYWLTTLRTRRWGPVMPRLFSMRFEVDCKPCSMVHNRRMSSTGSRDSPTVVGRSERHGRHDSQSPRRERAHVVVTSRMRLRA